MKQVLVIGGGAAGMLAALSAAKAGSQVTLLEKNEKLGKKIYITGKGRCNVTNACSFDEFLQQVTVNQRFLYSALRRFFNTDLCALLEAGGCALKTERGDRVFPVSDHASDVTKALEKLLRQAGVRICLNTEVTGIRLRSAAQTHNAVKTTVGNAATDAEAEVDAASTSACSKNNVNSNGQRFGFLVETRHCGTPTRGSNRAAKAVHGQEQADAVIICTGGLSYPSTGSTGDGYRFAKAFGLPVTETYPSLVPLVLKETDAATLQGLSLRNVELTVRSAGMGESLSAGSSSGSSRTEKPVFSAFGELLFTHFGISGPLILSASPYLTERLAKGEQFLLSIDLKPALSAEKLDERILREFAAQKNANLGNAVAKLLPSLLRPLILQRAGLSPEKKVHDITKAERKRLIAVIKRLDFTAIGTRGFAEAVITKGGVSVSAINPRTMEAKQVPGLYFAGEVLDVDAMTGGFNLQIAFSTGAAAGQSAG